MAIEDARRDPDSPNDKGLKVTIDSTDNPPKGGDKSTPPKITGKD